MLLYHLSVFVFNSYVLWYDQKYVELPSAKGSGVNTMPFKGRINYLTMWSLFISGNHSNQSTMLVYHLAVLLFNSYVIWYDQQYVDLPLPEGVRTMPYKARGIFLTFWCLALQTIYFGIALLNDIVGTNDKAPKNPPIIRRIKDLVFASAFTLALYVSATFWGLYFIDPELILPAHVQAILPSWVNHAMHTTIVPFIFLELLLTHRTYPTRKAGLSLALIINLAYVFWIHYLFFTRGIWVYPFLDVMSWPARTVFCCCSTIIGVFVYIFGEKIHYIVTPSRKVQVNGSKIK